LYHYGTTKDDEMTIQARREVDTMTQLSHENVVKILEAFVPPGRPLCMVCEYCEAGTLNDQLRERRRQGCRVLHSLPGCHSIGYEYSIACVDYSRIPAVIN
jgi:serine/threonine protein kinase